MATRSTINVKTKDGLKSIYCHWDGYPEHHMPILTEAYNSQELAESLVEHGNLSVLDRKNDKPAGHTFDNAVKGYCIYYGRDRGEDNQGYRIVVTKKQIQKEEFTYFWNGKKWSVKEEN